MAGLAAGDCIVEIDGGSILSDEDVRRWEQTYTSNTAISISFYRGAQLMRTVIENPNHTPSSPPGNSAANNASASAEISPDMLTSEYIQSLRAELKQLREELARSQNRVLVLERQMSER